MEKAGIGQPALILRKGKKKQSKDEVDRQKQAEKKKRRIEKALATSAAIRSELEKKKQKKLEELKRLEEEGAAIAEAVALHVLLGEDTDESCQIMLNGSKTYNLWDQSSNDVHVPHHGWNAWGIAGSCSPGMCVGALDRPYYDKRSQVSDVCPGRIAQAVSALHIADDSHDTAFVGQVRAAVVINRMMGGTNFGNKMNPREL